MVSSWIGTLKKARFEKYIYAASFESSVKSKITRAGKLDVQLVTFAGPQSFPDTVLSILSFIHSAGIPAKWILYADEEFSEQQKRIYETFGFVTIKSWDSNISRNDKEKYKHRWQFRKYLTLSTHRVHHTTIFLDSDVVFYNAFNKYFDFVSEGNWYLPEPVDAFSLDKRILQRNDYNPGMYIINSGFMILNQLPPWRLGMQYLEECRITGDISHFSEQSAINIVFANDRAAKILEPRVFHVSVDDQFDFKFVQTGNLAIRHYVGPIRHKMWQSGWEQFI